MWPLSRKSKPKQFQPLIGKKSPFQLMIERLEKGFALSDIFVVTGREYTEIVKKQIPKLSKDNLILEPEMRDTLGAVGLAVATLSKKFPDEVMAAIWGADHLVRNDKEFIKALKVAEKLAKEQNVIVKVDVAPTFPSVHLGYIQIEKKVSTTGGFEVYEFIKHVEKPTLPKARKFLESGDYLWNTGYLVWKNSVVMKVYQEHAPNVFSILKEIQKAPESQIKSLFSRIPKNSIDFALFEKLKKGKQLVIKADLGWTDIGAWDVLKKELTESKGANVISGNHVGIDTKGSLIFGPDEKKLIATIGLKDMIVVDTKEALLICPANRSQDIKKLVTKISKEKKDKYL